MTEGGCERCGAGDELRALLNTNCPAEGVDTTGAKQLAIGKLAAITGVTQRIFKQAHQSTDSTFKDALRSSGVPETTCEMVGAASPPHLPWPFTAVRCLSLPLHCQLPHFH